MSNESIKGRGTSTNPQNRFESTRYEVFHESVDELDDRKIVTQFLKDTTKSVLTKNDSPDIGFSYDLNPYRGCEHGCVYCYARPSHEYLGFSAGLDFETKIMVKPDVHLLLEKEINKKTWKPQVISFGGNTDCYQPIERKLELTRKCIEVLLKYKNPFGIITKNALITRDIDLLAELAKQNLVATTITITTLDKELQRKMEPRTSPPEQRLKAMEELAKAGIPVSVNVAPIIPGLNDSEIPAILKRASEHGATRAHWIMLRLPFAVKDLFVEWLKKNYPEKFDKIINRIKDVRDGKMNSTEWGERMRGTGELADSISQLFSISAEKYGLNKQRFHLTTELFEGKSGVKDQMDLFL